MDDPTRAHHQDTPWAPAQGVPTAPSHTPRQTEWRAWGPSEPATNHAAVWSWVVALPCAALGLVLGVLGLARARRRGGVGQTHAVVGLTASAFVLLACAAALPVALLVGVGSAAGAGDGYRGEDGTAPTALTQDEQDFIDGLWDETYFAFDDATLLEMGHGFCDDLDAGASPQDADAALLERWSDVDLDLDAAYDVEATATTSLCPAHAEEFSAWDPASGGGTGLTA